ncbi:MAG TPA: hydroxyacylglutathione hydrolase [Mizugakiibacter sp.]|nr:hydroxyacylglutathione hydrolase [Mizugakiibacter sp.]
MLELINLPAFEDNYIWMLADPERGVALAVDPGDAQPVEAKLHEQQWQLGCILITHHHPDHTGGVAVLAERHHPQIIAPDDPRIGHASQRVRDGETVSIDKLQVQVQVLAVPGHTRSHVAYHLNDWLFCGDTLFSLGCGRLFEGTPAQMLSSLDRFRTLQATTLVCAAHEYTLANARFALSVDPDNPDLQARYATVVRRRQEGLPSLPVMLDSEIRCNPFLRVDVPAIQAWCTRRDPQAHSRIERFAILRQAKDHFRE